MLECIITETKDIEPVIYEWGAVNGSPTTIWIQAASRASASSTSFRGKPTPSTGTRPRRRSCTCSRASATCAWAIELDGLARADALHPAGRQARGREQAAGSRSFTSAPSRRACAARFSRTLRARGATVIRPERKPSLVS